MKRFALLLLLLAPCSLLRSQGWPYDYGGVMMQGFYWDSYDETSWSKLQAQADEIAPYFQLIWIPQSGWCNSNYSMGYKPVYYFNQKSSFGTEGALRRMIAAYRERGTGIIADVVVNHRDNIGENGSWVDFPAETWNGQTCQMLPSDICRNDDGGQTATWASQHGISLSQNDDTGEDWGDCRDLDHKSANVQNCIKAYLRFLLEDIGYAGFRYDMVKGFYAYFIAEYNMAAKPAFSVGEYWDSTEKIREWVNYTRGYVSDNPTSAAFDFQFRYRVRDAINTRNWRWLGWDQKPLSAEDSYKQYAITFVENHDTEHRINGQEQDPIRTDTLAANAYLLAMPGTPCVFYTHWRDCKYPIMQMILARRLAGITNTSASEEKYSDDNFYAKATHGKNATLLCVVGNSPGNYNASTSEYQEILSGKGYRYLLSKNANTVWMDVPSGTYEAPLNVKLTAVTKLTGAKIVYTIDGTEPTATSQKVTSGTTLSINSSCTLTTGILSRGKVYGIQSREYNIFAPHDITIHVGSDINWGTMYFYAWDNNGIEFSGKWPGRRVTSYETINGKKWFRQTYHLTSPEQYVNIKVSNTAGNRKTIDVRGIRKDCYLRITGDKDEDEFTVEDQTDITTGIGLIQDDELRIQDDAYDLSGKRMAPHTPKKGVVIENGRKVAY